MYLYINKRKTSDYAVRDFFVTAKGFNIFKITKSFAYKYTKEGWINEVGSVVCKLSKREGRS